MAKMKTEDRQSDSIGFRHHTSAQMLKLMLKAQVDAVHCISSCMAELEQGAQQMAQTIRTGGRLVYCGAGSSGLMALADSLELAGTFGIDPHQVCLILAGGRGSLMQLTGAPDDDTSMADKEFDRCETGPDDCLICLSASGSTAFTLRVQQLAKNRNTPTIALANNQYSPLLEAADVPILLQTPPEVVAGSTRLGAGSAQKIALNMMSTLMASLLGHVYDGHMVNVQADSKKLRRRARSMVSDISGCDDDQASVYLANASGKVKLAILLASGCSDVDTASVCLEDSDGDIGIALASLVSNNKP